MQTTVLDQRMMESCLRRQSNNNTFIRNIRKVMWIILAKTYKLIGSQIMIDSKM